jgi:hypothetical protein
MSMRILVFILVCIVLAASGASAEKLYTWKDRDGNVHITDYPPPEGAVKTRTLDHEPRKGPPKKVPDIAIPGSSVDLKTLMPDKNAPVHHEDAPLLSIIRLVFGENEEILSMFRGITIQWLAALLFFGALGAVYIVLGVKWSHMIMVACGIALVIYIHFLRDMVTIAAVGACLGIIPLLSGIFLGRGRRR